MAIVPIAIILFCPMCHTRHIDVGEWESKPHHTHTCQSCGFTWRPCIENTVGVQFLPGCKNENPLDEPLKMLNYEDVKKEFEQAKEKVIEQYNLDEKIYGYQILKWLQEEKLFDCPLITRWQGLCDFLLDFMKEKWLEKSYRTTDNGSVSSHDLYKLQVELDQLFGYNCVHVYAHDFVRLKTFTLKWYPFSPG